MLSGDIVTQMTRGKIFLIFHSDEIRISLFEETCLLPCTVEFTRELIQGTDINRKFTKPDQPRDLSKFIIFHNHNIYNIISEKKSILKLTRKARVIS